MPRGCRGKPLKANFKMDNPRKDAKGEISLKDWKESERERQTERKRMYERRHVEKTGFEFL